MKSLLIFIALALSTASLAAQTHSCGFDHLMDEIRKDDVIKSKLYNNDQLITSNLLKKSAKDGSESRTTQYTLPVIVHVMEYNGNDLLTDAEVFAGIESLNTDFNSGSSAAIDFCPAQRSPQNTQVNGINRVDCNATYCGKYSGNGKVQTYGPETTMLKDMSTWMPTDYINIWVVHEIQGQNGNTLGFSTFPNSVTENLEGIVIDYNYFNTGVLTHEIGHYLGLYHTFEGTVWGCIDGNDCNNTGDMVCDTAPHKKDHTCDSADTSNECCTDGCNGIGSDYETYAYNYMSYSDVECLSRFTPGQTDRMRAHVETFYNSLTYSNGCNPPCLTDEVTLDGPHDVAVDESNIYSNTTSGSSDSAWYLDGQLVSNTSSPAITIQSQGLHTLCLFTTVNGCPQDYCETLYALGDITSCESTSYGNCDYTHNGDMESSVSIADNIGYIENAYHFSQYSPQWDLVCNWYNRTSSPLYCTEGNGGKFMLGINYDNRESIGTVKPLDLKVGKEYVVSIDYSAYSYNSIETPMNHFIVGLSHTVYQSDAAGNNEDLIKVVSPANEPILYEPGDFCSYEAKHTATATFTYSADMGQYLFVEGVDDQSRNRLIVDNISVVNCDLACTIPFSSKQQSECTVDFDGDTHTEIISCKWDFGDGSTAQGIQASHSYDQSGIYNVCMTRECIADLQVICKNVEIKEWDTTEYLTTELSTTRTDEGIEINYTLCNDSPTTLDNLEITINIPEALSIQSDGGMSDNGSTLNQALSLSVGCHTLTVNAKHTDTCPCGSVVVSATAAYYTQCKTVVLADESVIELNNETLEVLDYEVAFDCSEVTLTVVNPSPCVDYQWSIGNEVIQGTKCTYDFGNIGEYDFDLTATDACGTTLKETKTIDVTCETPVYNCTLPSDAIIFEDDTQLSTYISDHEATHSFTGKTFFVRSTLTVDVPVTFSGCTFYFADDGSLSIAKTDSPVAFVGTTMTACNEIWEGMVIAKDASVEMRFGTRIENANIGINATQGVDNLFVYRSKLINNTTAAKISTCDSNDSVAFDEVSIYTDATSDLTGLNGIEVQSNENFVYVKRSNFRNLQTAIYTNNANIVVKNACTFSNIGSENVVNDHRNNIHASAIVAENQSYLNVVAGNSFHCDSGISLNQSTGNITNNTFEVINEAIISAYDQSGLLQIAHNSIISTERGVDLTSVSHATVYDNTVRIKSTGNNDFGAGITMSNDIGGEITSNLIELYTGKSGIVLNNQTNTTVKDNTLVNGEDNKNKTIGINISGGAKHTIGCNAISAFTPSARHIGISVIFSNSNDFVQNEFDNLDTGLMIQEMSDDQGLKCNVFASGNIGMDINSNIGMQGHNSNQWAEGGWSIADATTALTTDELSLMQFQVNGTSYPYTPGKIQADGEWFESNAQLENTPCVNCSETRNDFASEKDNFLEALCQQVTQHTNNNYLENLQLLKLVKANNLVVSQYSCIKQFVKQMNEKSESKYTTVAGLLKSAEVHTIESIKAVNKDLMTAMTEQNTPSMVNIKAEVKQLQSQLTLDRTMQIYNATAINSGVKAKSDIAKTWKDLHTNHLNLVATSKLSLTPAQYRELTIIATDCPANLGQVVFTARDILSRITRVDYSQYDCTEAITDPQPAEEATTDETIERSRTEVAPTDHIAINVYPNPTSDYINITVPSVSESVAINIYASNGALVESVATAQPTEMIPVSTWDAGSYIVQVINDNHITHNKVIVY